MFKHFLTRLCFAAVVVVMTSCQQGPKEDHDASSASTDTVVSKNIKPAESGYAEVNGQKMYYEVSGEGDPLVGLHGAYMNILSMGEIIPKLANTHKVYALEFQGHGRTNDIDRPITYP